MKTLAELYGEEADALRVVKLLKIGVRKAKRELDGVRRAIYEMQQLKLFDDVPTEGATVSELREFVKRKS